MKKIFNEFIAFAMFSMVVGLIGVYQDYSFKQVESENDIVISTIISFGNVTETHTTVNSKTSSRVIYRQSITLEYNYNDNTYNYTIPDMIVQKDGVKIGESMKIYVNKEDPTKVSLYSSKSGSEPLYLFAIVILAIGTAKTLLCGIRLKIKEEKVSQ